MNAAALAALAVLATPRPPAPFPASVPLYNGPGDAVCRAAPMPDGAYSAAHCVHVNGRLWLGGRAPDYSVDAGGRDLMHLAAAGDPSVRLRAPVEYETVRWQNDRGAGRGVVVQVSARAFEFVRTSGDVLNRDDSGTGLHGDDGALVGIVAELDFRLPDYAPLGTGAAVRVP